MAPDTARVFANAEKIAQKAGDFFVTASACCPRWRRRRGEAANTLEKAGVSAETPNAAIHELRKGRTPPFGKRRERL